jgi:nucleoside-diphosphate-sugar epimerase
MKILVTGGAGYVGCVLTPHLLKQGHTVTVLDLFIYGDNLLPKHNNLRTVSGDIRDRQLVESIMEGHDTVIHLACISNDPSFELNPDLGRSINLDAFEPLVKISVDSGVKRFIYASSSSVYGVKDVQDVNEDMALEPLTDYSKFKVDCENILGRYQSDNFCTVTLRPATVCGYSPRQRLDVVVNILTNLAYHKREITVFGGEQLRPNIHIGDMVNAYDLLLSAPTSVIAGDVFNAGYENHTVNQLAEMVRDAVGQDVKILRQDTEDNRSYHVSSQKIASKLGFQPSFTIQDAVVDLINAFDKKLLENTLENEMYFNIKRMQSLSLS